MQPSTTFQPVSQVVARPLPWLWPGRIALGKLAILDGDPGVGKSLLTLDLCARLSTGRAWPDGAAGVGPADALVLNAEDHAADTLRPRLHALGADLQRVHVPDAEAGPSRLPDDVAALDEAVARTGARLVVIDPILAFLNPSAAASDAGTRHALRPLARLAEKHACAVLLVRHLNKRGLGRSLYRGTGSIALIGVCRSAWLAAHDPHAPDQCVLAQVKNNIAPPQPSLAYTVTSPATAAPLLNWTGPTPWTADELLATVTDAGVAPELRRASDFLTGFLASGPRTAPEIWAAAQQHDLSERTLARAKHDLGIRSERGSGRVSYWLLPGQSVPARNPTADFDAEIRQYLDPGLKPPSSPLDRM